MKPIILSLSILSVLALAACGDERPATHSDKVDANNNAASQADKAFDKENPADPAALQAAPK